MTWIGITIFCLIGLAMIGLLEIFRRRFGNKHRNLSENSEFLEEIEYLTVPQLMERLVKLERRRDSLRTDFIHQSTEEQQSKVDRISKINEKIDLLNKTIAERTKSRAHKKVNLQQ